MTPTQDPLYTAKRLLRHASKTQQTAWLGYQRNAPARHRLLIASYDRADLVSGAASESIAIPAGIQPETLAATLAAVWGRLQGAGK